MFYPRFKQDDLTEALLKRAPEELQPEAPVAEPPIWGKRRRPPVTHQFGYKGGGLISTLKPGKMLNY